MYKRVFNTRVYNHRHVAYSSVAGAWCSGAVALDGRIEPGDMILEVNGISFENLGNDDAVRILRDVVQKSGSVTNNPHAYCMFLIYLFQCVCVKQQEVQLSLRHLFTVSQVRYKSLDKLCLR